MPPDIDDVVLNIDANTADAVSGIVKINDTLKKLRGSLERLENSEVARQRRFEADAKARIAASNKEKAAINQVANELKAMDALSIRLSNERSARLRKETAEYNKQIAAINDKHRAADRELKQFTEAERTKRSELKKTTDAANAAARSQLEAEREVNREKARRFRREERIAQERFQRGQNIYGQAALGAGLGAGLGQKLTNLIGQVGAIAGGLYVVQAGIGSIVRDRARVQRLEVGVRDLTDEFRAQAVLPQLQEIALLPGLDYVTATQAFTRALSGGFTDQQSLRLINQIRNAVALSQGSIEDTNEVLRQFIQIQARDRFDQENLRPILERAPFIRRVIQGEFGTQIGGEIQQVLEQRGLTTTEGILRIVEGLAAGPVADPTTLQNALDNVGNELILLRNELGRRIQPILTALVDGFTGFLRFMQGAPGAIASGSIAGAIGLGTAGLGINFLRGRHRAFSGDILQRSGYSRFQRQLYPTIGGRTGAIAGPFAGLSPRARGRIGFFGDLAAGVTNILPWLDEPGRVEEELRGMRQAGARFRRRGPEYARNLLDRARRRGIQNISLEDIAARTRSRFFTPEQQFLQNALFLNDFGEVQRGQRFWSSVVGREGQRAPFFQRVPRQMGRYGMKTGLGFGLASGLAIGVPGLLAAGGAIIGGAAAGGAAFETVARGGVQSDAWWAPIANTFNSIITAGTGLADNFIRLSESTKDLVTGVGIPNYQALSGDIATRQAGIHRAFDTIRRAGALPLPAGSTREQRKQITDLIKSLNELQDILSGGTTTAGTERQRVIDRIWQLQRRSVSIRDPGDPNDPNAPGPINVMRTRTGELVGVTEQDEERRQALESVNKQLRQQEEILTRISEQKSKITTATKNQLEVEKQLTASDILRSRQLEDFTSKADTAYLRKIFPKEDLDSLNAGLQVLGRNLDIKIPKVTYESLAKSLKESSENLGNMTRRPIITGLGQLRDEFGNLTRSAKNFLDTIKPIAPRTPLPSGVPLGFLRPGIPTIPGLPRGGSFGTGAIDIEGAGLRQIRSTPGSVFGTGPLVSGDRARAEAFRAVEEYRKVQGTITQGTPFDPNNPATIIPRDPGETLDVVTIDKFRKLNSAWQELLETSKEFGKTRGIFDFARSARRQEIAGLIVQISKLKMEFVELRNSLPEDSPLRQQLLYLVNTPIEQLTRQIRDLKKELVGLSGTALQIESIKDSFNRLIAPILGREGGRTGLRALGRQLGGFFERFDRREGREIIRERQLERARAFEAYFASTAEGLYDQFIAPSILDAVGIGPGRSTNHERALQRLKEDRDRVRQETLDDERITEERRATELLEINREYLKEKRDLERAYEQERKDAWGAWVRQQLTDFPKLIFQQLNLQLAARTTNAILRSLGIGGRIPITGPGIPGLGGTGGGAAGGGGGGIFGWIRNLFGGGSGGVRPELTGYSGGGGGAGGIGASSAVGTAAGLGTAASFALAAHNIATGVVPQWNPHGQSLYDDFGYDVASATGLNSVVTFFDNLIFHNARNDAMARSAGMQARIEGSAARLGRESARDIVENFSEGFNEGNSQGKMYMVPSNTTFSMPIIIGDQETRQISYTIDQLMSEGRL